MYGTASKTHHLHKKGNNKAFLCHFLSFANIEESRENIGTIVLFPPSTRSYIFLLGIIFPFVKKAPLLFL